MAHTELIFLQDTFQFENTATVTDDGEDDDGPYVVTNATVFYPGGGGQEPDRGTIITARGNTCSIQKAAPANGQIRHYVTDKLSPGDAVTIRIDREHRLQNAKLHTGGHLLSSVVYESLQWPLRPVKGFHYQQGAYIEFEPLEDMPGINRELLARALYENIKKLLPVTTTIASKDDEAYTQAFKPAGFIPPADRPLRLVRIGPYRAYPCGGTHLHHTGELTFLQIKHVKHKKGNIRIAYEAG